MEQCCEAKTGELAALRLRQGRVLATVLAVNVIMFFVEFGAGLLAGSTALLADSLDMLGDAFVYGFSLFVLHQSSTWRARAALAKGLIMASFGLGVLVEAALGVRSGVPPLVPAMAAIGTLALVANAFCFSLQPSWSRGRVRVGPMSSLALESPCCFCAPQARLSENRSPKLHEHAPVKCR